MKTDKSQDKYNEIFQELREEKMNWDFEDFLAEAEKEKNLTTKISEKKSASFPKFYWMAASVVLLVSMGVFYKISDQNKMDEQDQLVKNEILKQKEITISHKINISILENYIWIAPNYTEIIMNKKSKESYRRNKIPKNIRAYIFCKNIDFKMLMI